MNYLPLRSLFSIVFILIMSLGAIAQEQAGIGDWESYLPHRRGAWVTQSPTHIIYATPLSILTIDKTDESVQYLSKVDGLSDTGVKQVAYDESGSQLLIVYANNNIDVYKDGAVTNFPNIKDNNTITGDKSIQDIHMHEGKAYLCTAFGLVVLDLIDMEFDETVITGLPVTSSAVLGDLLFVATEEGVYRVDRSGGTNIKDFAAWKLLGPAEGMPSLASAEHLAAFGGRLYASVEQQVYRGDGQTMELYASPENQERVAFLSANPNYLMIGWRNNSNSKARVDFVSREDQLIATNSGCNNLLLYGIVDEQGRAWYADEWAEIRSTANIYGDCRKVVYDGPKDSEVSDIAIKNGKVLVASGGVSDNFTYLFSRDGYYLLEDGKWSIYDQSNVDLLKEKNMLNYFVAEWGPKDSIAYIGTYWGGVIRHNLVSGQVTVFDKSNSTLQGAIGDEQRTRVAGLALDDDDNLWVSNFEASVPLSVYTPEGNWHRFEAPTSNRSLEEIAIDDNGYKWIVAAGNSGGVIVFDEGEGLADPTDDRVRYFSSSNSAIEANQVYSVAVDLSGDVWVGTAEGPIVFECGSGVFDNTDCKGTQRKVLQDSIPALLLATEQILTIAVDGANRKWFGTRRGIFVQSPDGEDQLARYTEDNSPLFDNVVNKLSYDGESGKMYVATDRGLQSIRTATTAGSRTHNPSKVYAYPNPVRPDYAGDIAIKGLAANAQVKITDLNGRLVYETIAQGGQAIWDGRDYNGRRADTGVYLVFSGAKLGFDGVDAFVTKILLVD